MVFSYFDMYHFSDNETLAKWPLSPLLADQIIRRAASGCLLRNKNAFRTKSNYECLALVQEDSVLITPISTTIVLFFLVAVEEA